MEFQAGGSVLYHTDTKAKTISRFLYDLVLGALGKPEVVVKIDDGDAVPDGLIIDADGTLLSAQWGGGRIACFSPGGLERPSIKLPCRQVASLAFGGADYGDLYVTTAGGNDRKRNGSSAGALFRARHAANGCGPPMARVKLS
jgi:D-xylonolactonase